ESSIISDKNFADIFRESDDGENDVRVRGDGLWAICGLCAEFEQRLQFVLAAIIDRGRKSLTHGVLAHPAPHDAGADPADAGFARLRDGKCHCKDSVKKRCLPTSLFEIHLR